MKGASVVHPGAIGASRRSRPHPFGPSRLASVPGARLSGHAAPGDRERKTREIARGPSTDRIQITPWYLNVRGEIVKPDQVQVHQLRHAFACRWIERGGSLAALQQLLGHSSIVTTQRYARLMDESVFAEARRLSGQR